MIKEARGFGNSINEARQDAISKLGAKQEDDVKFETITMYKKGFLGIGSTKAEVRAYIEIVEEKKKNNKKHNKKEQTKNQTDEKKAEEEITEKLIDKFPDAVEESQIPADSQSGIAIAYLKTLLVNLGCSNITMKVAVRDSVAHIFIEGDGLGAIIGRRGETLDSLQYLTALAANNGGGHFRVSLNVGTYREKREQALIALAKRVSAQVVKSGKNSALEPMNPYERRIIHTAVQEIQGVESSSVGEGAHRRVVIFPEGGDAKLHRTNGRNDRRDKKPSNTVATTPTREPKKDSDIPLYGKIN